MAITKAKKQDIIAKLTEALIGATAAVFVRFNKLTVADVSAMRKNLKKDGVEYYVAKKTLLKRALTARGFAGDIPELEGEIAIAWSTGDDATLPAREVHGYAKKLKGAVALVGGVFEKAFVDAAGILAIATIPPVPVLRGMFVNVINSPIQGLVVALNQISLKKS